jgi:hypothetical protein
MRSTALPLAALLLGAIVASGQVAAPYTENFDGVAGPLPVVVTNGAPTGTFGGGNWDFTSIVANGRARIASAAQIAVLTAPPATSGNGPQFLAIDSNVNATVETSTLALHIDGLASDAFGSGFQIRVLLKENNDEADNDDVIAITDGATAGNGVFRTGVASAIAGYGGFKEALLEDWNTATPTIQSAWQERVYNITPAFLTANGMTMGANMVFLVRQRDNSTVEGGDGLAIDNVRVSALTSVDVGVDLVTAPSSTVGCTTLSATETVTVQVRNFSGVTLAAGTNIAVSYTINGGAPVNEVLTTGAAIATNGTAAYSFTATANLSTPGASYLISASATTAGDQDGTNDAAAKTVVSGFLLTGTWLENFDATVWNGVGNGSIVLPAGWQQEIGENAGGTDSDWYLRNTDTTSTGTGPVADHTTGVSGVGYYAYVEDSTGNFAAVSMRTPCCDVSGLTNPTLFFWMQNIDSNGGTNQNFLHVDVITYPGAVVTSDVIPAIGNLGDFAWHQFAVNLAPFAGTQFEVRFRGTSNGGSFTSDVCVDDVQMVDLVLEGGQEPQLGLAVLDINNATNQAGFGVGSGLAGPYYAPLAMGTVLDMSISGAPNQPIILLAGPLNIGVADYSGLGIGQLDIGVPAVPIPSNIVILADGTSGGGLFGFYFVTDGAGSFEFSIGSTALPVGTNITFQAAVLNGGPSVVSLSNAVNLTIL